MDFFKQQASSFLSQQGNKKSSEEEGEAKRPNSPPPAAAFADAAADVKHEPKKKSEEEGGYGELLSSANVVMNAVKGGEKGGKVDYGKVAGAANDLLEAAERHGKLEGSAYGNYIDKAQEFLNDYESKHSSSSSLPSKKKDVEESAPQRNDNEDYRES